MRTKFQSRNWHVIGWLVVCCLAAIFMATNAHAQTAPTMTFTAQTTTGNGSVVPAFTWSTTPAAQSCTATATPADPNWSGSKPVSGSKTLAAITSSVNYSLQCSWLGDTTATVSWTAPTTNTDGTALAKCTTETTGTCLKSFLVLRGSDATSVGMDSKPVADPTATSFAWTGLAVGTHWFSVQAVNANGVMSDQAVPPVSKVITAGSAITRTVSITVNPKPSPATGVGVQ